MTVARHTIYNLVGALAPLAVTLVTVPLYLKIIGLERFGILALIWVLVGYFAFFDFGIGRATAQKMASLPTHDSAARNRLFWASCSVTLLLVFLAALVSWPVAQLVLDWVDLTAALRSELAESLPLIVAAVPIGITQSLLNGALEGRRAFGPINAIAVAGNSLTATLPLASAWILGPDIAILVAATLLSRILVIIIQTFTCRQLVPISRPTLPQGKEIKSLLSFGSWVTISGIVGPILVYIDRLAIGAWIGTSALGFYVIGFNLVAQLQIVPASLARSLFPRLAELGPEQSLGRSNDAIRAMAGIVTPLTVMACVCAAPFFELWLGSSVAEHAGPVTVLLLVGFWPNALAQIPLIRLHSMGRPDQPAKAHVLEIAPYVAALWAGIGLFKLPGAAVAWSLRALLDFVALYALAGLSRNVVSTLGIHFAIVLATSALILLTKNAGWLLFESLALLTVAAIAGWAIFPPHLRRQVLQLFDRPNLGGSST